MKEIAELITIYVSHAVEIAAAIIIAFALLNMLYRYLAFRFTEKKILSKEKIRVEFGSSVAMALELMLGADVLATAVAPAWNDIGQLAAIAVIRTALNYFLSKELKEIHAETRIPPDNHRDRIQNPKSQIQIPTPTS